MWLQSVCIAALRITYTYTHDVHKHTAVEMLLLAALARAKQQQFFNGRATNCGTIPNEFNHMRQVCINKTLQCLRYKLFPSLKTGINATKNTFRLLRRQQNTNTGQPHRPSELHLLYSTELFSSPIKPCKTTTAGVFTVKRQLITITWILLSWPSGEGSYMLVLNPIKFKSVSEVQAGKYHYVFFASQKKKGNVR